KLVNQAVDDADLRVQLNDHIVDLSGQTIDVALVLGILHLSQETVQLRDQTLDRGLCRVGLTDDSLCLRLQIGSCRDIRNSVQCRDDIRAIRRDLASRRCRLLGCANGSLSSLYGSL